ECPGEQGGGAEDVAQAVPGPLPGAVGVAPAGGVVGGLEDVAVEVGGTPVLAGRGGGGQAEGVGACLLLGAGGADAGGEPVGEGVAGGGGARVDGLAVLA